MYFHSFVILLMLLIVQVQSATDKVTVNCLDIDIKSASFSAGGSSK